MKTTSFQHRMVIFIWAAVIAAIINDIDTVSICWICFMNTQYTGGWPRRK